MYNAPEWYSDLRSIVLLWLSLGGVMIFWRALPRRRRARVLCGVFWLAGGAALYALEWLWPVIRQEGFNVFLVYALCTAMVYACCRVPLLTAWMVGSTGFLAQQLGGSLELAFRAIPAVGRIFDNNELLVVLEIVFYTVVYLVLIRVFRHTLYRENGETSPVQKVTFSLISTLFSLGFFRINQYIRGWQNLNWIELEINALYISTGAIFLLALQYGIIRSQRAAERYHIMSTLLYAQQNQYRTSRESMELVNEKYHDLKKLVHSFRGRISGTELDALEDAVSAYDDHVSTGNQIVDVVLMDARARCRKNGIQLTCYVQGKDLAFLQEMDTYFLLKNALDNAMEAVCSLSAGEDRFISLTARKEGEMVVIHSENPCREVTFLDGLPQTQKDTKYHGFGMKSMERIAARYGGTLSCAVKKNVFYLDVILLPDAVTSEKTVDLRG